MLSVSSPTGVRSRAAATGTVRRRARLRASTAASRCGCPAPGWSRRRHDGGVAHSVVPRYARRTEAVNAASWVLSRVNTPKKWHPKSRVVPSLPGDATKESFLLRLTRKERRRLEAMARKYTSPYRDVIRAKIVLYAAEGLSNDEIPPGWIRHDRSSASGGSAFSRNDFEALRSAPGDVRPSFPPRVAIEVKALACELPAKLGIPLSRFSVAELRCEVLHRGLVASIGTPRSGVG